MTAPLIALLTDFGARDWYVAAVKGVLLTRCPAARLLDITHEVPPQDVVAGAFILAAATPWLPPKTITVAVVDPGVGTSRAILACRVGGRYFIGPDNGVLSLCLRAGSPSCVAISPRRLGLRVLSRTFHARDIMAPAAALLAAGRRLESLGTPVVRTACLPMPAVTRSAHAVTGRIAHIDAYGNLITTLSGAWLARRRGRLPRLRCRDRMARVVSSYAEGRAREVVALTGSLGLIEVAVRDGSAARALRAKRHDPVSVLWPPR